MTSAMSEAQGTWHGYWSRDQDDIQQLALLLAGLREELFSGVDGLPELCDADLVAGLRRLHKSALGCDHFCAGQFKQLAEPWPWAYQARAALLEVLRLIETRGALPLQTLFTVVALIPKPQGDVRPIALLSMLYRLWIATRHGDLVDWDSRAAGPWDDAIQKSSALRASLFACCGR